MQANNAKEKTLRTSIKEKAELAKAEFAIEESMDNTGTVKGEREGIVNKLESAFENSYVEGYSVILDNGYEIFVNKSNEIIVRNYEESDVASITASYTIEKWQEGIQNTDWERSKLNEIDTDTTGVPVPIGFFVLEGDVDTGLVIKNNTTDDEFVWIPVDNKAKIIVNFKSKNDLKIVTGPEGSKINMNKRTATVEFTTDEAGLYEFYAEDKNKKNKYYDVDLGGINLAQDFTDNEEDRRYTKNATESQKKRFFIQMCEDEFGMVDLEEKEILKIINTSLWENWDDAARSDYWLCSSLEDWYYNFANNSKENATEEEMQQAFIDMTDDKFGIVATTFEEIKQIYQNKYIDEYGEKTTTVSNIEEFGQVYFEISSIDEWYKEEMDTETLPDELKQSVSNYGGFYVGRYEAGSSSVRKKITNNTITNPIIQKNQYPYNYISQDDAITACENYAGRGMTTPHLLYGGEWDAIMQYIVDKKALGDDSYNKVKKDSSEWGNYACSTFSFTGKYATYYDYFEEGNVNKQKGDHYLLETGICERNKVLNIYDLAGNVSEWTQAKYSVIFGVYRGKDCIQDYRCWAFDHGASSGAYPLTGFRLGIYI